MSVFKTLKDLQAKTEKPAPYSGGGERVQKFLTLKDKENVKLRFRQELTQDAEGYTEEAGQAQLQLIHTSPADFRKNAVCTSDREEWGYTCWACSQVTKDRGWKAKQHLVINVAIFNVDDKVWEARILDQKFTPAHVAEQIVEYAAEYGTLLDREYKLSRKGEKQATNYNLTPLSITDVDESVAPLTVFELGETYRYFSPAEQESFYLSIEDSGKSDGWQ